VWGSGFISPESPKEEIFKRKMEFSAVRGELTLKRVNKILNGAVGEIPLGDPGLLSSYLVDAPYKKKFRVGIVPHYIDQKDPIVPQVMGNLRNATVIDVCEDPLETVKKISECELVISSAMHGLIVADSLSIPNIRIKISDQLIGGDYKFRDYYSAYGMEMPEFIDLRKRRFTEDDFLRIESLYKIKQDDVARIKDKLIQAFPFK
jgi:hypothetical protein